MIGHSLLFFAAVACPTMIVLSLIPIKNGEAIHKQADSNNHIFKATSHFSHHLTIRGGPNQQPRHSPPLSKHDCPTSIASQKTLFTARHSSNLLSPLLSHNGDLPRQNKKIRRGMLNSIPLLISNLWRLSQ